MKLKTLKEIEKCSIINCTSNMHQKGVSSRELKQEAIKWVKEPYIYLGDGEYQFKESGMKFRWNDLLKFIFNITEEDLK